MIFSQTIACLRRARFCFFVFVISAISISTVASTPWGFYAHKLINRMALFTLPGELLIFYKPEIEYMTAHAVDADKRRYATTFEAVRHYIDLDHLGTYPYDRVPRKWSEALRHFSHLQVSNGIDSFFISGREVSESILRKEDHLPILLASGDSLQLPLALYHGFFNEAILPGYYSTSWTIDCAPVSDLLPLPTKDCWSISVTDSLTPHGILPYHLFHQQKQLTEAFRTKNSSRILRLSVDMGHYLADAHVPLHTTSNYNGQLSDQLGIHAFWESRIPELFAEKEYDFFAGKAQYISDPAAFFWEVVLESHLLVDRVLGIEKSLSESFPIDRQYCFEQRNNQTVRTECKDYAKAYHDHLEGMVEDQMRKAIQRIGSAWYTAWVDAGQPTLAAVSVDSVWQAADKKLEEEFKNNEIKGRKH